jgi:hypothetical protein
MKKREYERISSNMQVNYFYNNAMYTGTVTNLSKNGMYIKTEASLPFKSKFEVLIPFKSKIDIIIPLEDEVMEVPVKVRRLVKEDGHYEGMGVELSNPSQDYLEFLNKLTPVP